VSSVACPAGWSIKPLIDVATLQRGYDLPVQDREEGKFPIFAANGPVGFHSSAKCEGPGVVTGRSGTIGKVHFVEGDYWPLNTSLYVTDFHGNEPKWVFYMLRDFGFERFSQGAGVPTLNRNLVHSEPIKVPPLPEQRRIAAILDKADALRTKRREALAQLDRLAQSIFVEMFGDPVTNSKGWNLASLPEATDFQEGPGILAKDFRENGIPLVRLAGMGGAEVSLRGCNYVESEMFARKWSHFALSEGDILVLTSATFGNPTVVGKEAVGALFYTGIIRFRPQGVLISDQPQQAHSVSQ
jgi:type I restriction enzyme S subunit